MLKQTISYKKQRGFTLTGWMLVITLVLYFAYLAMIIVPSVMGHHTITRILDSLQEEPGITQKSRRDIWRLINAQFTVNRVQNVTREDIEIIKENDRVTIYIDYDDKIHFASNIYILIERSNSVELIRN